MESSVVYVKNMVCPRCIMAVERVFVNLAIPYRSVKLGEVHLSRQLSVDDKDSLSSELKPFGFEFLEQGKSILISQIKSLLINQIHFQNEPLKVNFSTYLAEKLHHDYSYLSRLFSGIESVTIEKFITGQKIEKVKELLFYNEYTLSEIAYQLNYSSLAHLSAQFKKETGMTPTTFKLMKRPGHRHRDGSCSKS